MSGVNSTKIYAKKIPVWMENFRGYRHPPKISDIISWLQKFEQPDQKIGAKILDNVRIVSDVEIHQGYKESLKLLQGWDNNPRKRKGNWYFCGYGDPNKSGPAMLRLFSEANNLRDNASKKLFITPSQIMSLNLQQDDTLVFVDDISGTGEQAVSIWNETIRELVGGRAPRIILLLTVATLRAKEFIEAETDLRVVASSYLGDDSNIFNVACSLLSKKEKAKLLEYCKTADKRNPKGYGNCGLVLILSHKTPNHTIPILHVNNKKWKGLFPRFLPTS